MERELGRERVRVAIGVACGVTLLIVLFLRFAPHTAHAPGVLSKTETAVAVATRTPVPRVSLKTGRLIYRS